MSVHGFRRTATGRIVLRVDVVEKGLLTTLLEQLIDFVTPEGAADEDPLVSLVGLDPDALPVSADAARQFAVRVPQGFIARMRRGDHLLGVTQCSIARCRQQRHGRDPITSIEPQLTSAWGQAGQRRLIRWPLHFLTGFPNR